MSYDKPFKLETIDFPAAAFGAGTISRRIIGPRGKKGVIKDIRVFPTAAFVGTTTVPEICIGSAASAPGALFNEYARFRLGSAAGVGYPISVPQRARAIAAALPHPGGVPPVAADFPGHVELEKNPIPANTEAVISLVAGAGGAPAGTATVEVDILWD